MVTHLLDTNVVICAMRDRPAGLRERFDEHRGRLCVSTITEMELAYGVARSQRVAENALALEGFLARLEVWDFDSAAAQHCGDIRAHLADTGMPIGPYDAMLAGHARSHGLILVTNNTREFERVPGLRIEDWV